MLQYIVRRLLFMIPTFAGIILVSFLILKLAPGDPASQKFGGMGQAGGGIDAQRGTETAVRQFREKYKLDESLDVQFVAFLQRLAAGELTRFSTSQPIWDEFSQKLLVTVQINVIVFFLIYLFAVPLGIFSASFPHSFPDRVSTVGLFVLYSLPSFWVATILQNLLCGPEGLPAINLFSNEFSRDAGMPVHEWYRPWRWFAYFQWDRFVDWSKHVFLPILCLTYGGLAYLSRQMRAGMLEVIQQDYIRTARAKGAGEPRVILVHALRNGLFPVITLFATLLPALVGGSVIIESVFEIPGMGNYAFKAVLQREYDIVMATLMMSTFLTLVGILLSDILYVLVNPKVSFESQN